ncbi:MAG TPA: glycosyl hydrolase family 18 protein [Patescibacteria group bacterium]|nr:glycosyl hydrolase family 18 protein [Patescibacteria group bacterium]
MHIKSVFIVWAGIIAGLFLGYFLITKTNVLSIGTKNSSISNVFKPPQKIVIGFLPFWLIDKASDDYSSYITQLSYFNVTIDSDGTIQKYTSPGQSDPGWHALFSGKVDSYLANAKSKGINLSLTVFSGDDEKITQLLNDPIYSAANLVHEISPVLLQYGFTDLNLDIEKIADATPTERQNFSNFVSDVRNSLNENITITVDCPPISFVKDKNLCDPKTLSEVSNYIVLMDYDFHNQGSSVTGPVSPQSGAGIGSEFDTESAVQAALSVVPARKLVLATPLYGYSWETINPTPRSAVIPASAFSISTRSIEEFLADCASCSATFDETDQESHYSYKDIGTGTFYQVFYPNKTSMQVKVDFAKSQNLGGMALWALGYEDSVILQPLSGMGATK